MTPEIFEKTAFLHIAALLAGTVLDLVLGDPHFMPHPVRAIGRYISFLERKLYPAKRSREILRIRGALLWFITVFTVTGAVLLLLFVSFRIGGYAFFITETVLQYYILAAGSLYRESMKVYIKLRSEDLNASRQALSMIVGRDTENLTQEEVIKAAVETVSENTTDGVIAPLLFTAFFGPAAGMLYKAVNTMDSMLGYHNERYEDFGFFAARFDDILNFVPSRLAALLMTAGCSFLGLFSKEYDAKNAFLVWKRDRRNHLSPNSAQTESVCAGALGIRLGGTHMYNGILVGKPFIGDEKRKARPLDIIFSNRLMFSTEAAFILVFLTICLYCLWKI